MYVDIKIETLRTMLREELTKILEEKEADGKRKDPPFNIQQLADHFGKSKATIHNWLNRGLIVGFKMGKGRFFNLHEVEASLKKYRHLDEFKRVA